MKPNSSATEFLLMSTDGNKPVEVKRSRGPGLRGDSGVPEGGGAVPPWPVLCPMRDGQEASEGRSLQDGGWWWSRFEGGGA